jgi:glycosyltransferase involved in cell wall biosynthesis
VVLPAFNAARTLPRAIESILRQTCRDWELILVDDGSADDTLAVAQACAAQDSRIRIVRQAHGGIVASLNAGIAWARAPLIARMDADDESHPERLTAQLALMEKQTSVGVVGSLVQFGGDPARAAGYALHVEWLNTIATPEDIALNRFVESPFAHPCVTFRRELVERFGRYQAGDFPEDYELWLRWLDAGVRMTKVPRVLLTWHDLPERLSRRDPRYKLEAFYRCKAIYLARWLRANVDPRRTFLAWGAGRLTRRRVEFLKGEHVTIAGYIDIDPRKFGRQHRAHVVLAPDQIPAREECFVIGYVARRGAREFARANLRSRGFVEGRDFLMAA